MTTWARQFLGRPTGAPAVIHADARWSTGDLAARAATAARWLARLPTAVGQPVPALVWSSPTAVAALVGGALSGRPLAPVGPLLTESEVEAVLGGLASPVVVHDGLCTALAEAVALRLGARAVPLPERFEPAPGGDPGALVSPGSRSVAAVLHTSGTSGRPTPVALAQGPLGARTVVNGGLLDLGPGAAYVTAKGIHHIGGLGLALAALGAGAALIPCPRFTMDRWAEVADLGPTHASVVPTMIDRWLEAGSWRPPTLRLLQYGGAPIDPGTLSALLESEPDLDVVALYGQTEGSPIAVLTADDHRAAAAGDRALLSAAGRPAPGVELSVADPDDRGVGEVWARADHFFAPDPDGWLRTGDLGHLDERGYLRLVGRRGDVINRGGESVHPAEVEAVVAECPGVVEVAVAGVADRRLGARVAAWLVVADPSAAPSDAELRAFTRARLAGFKVPEAWYMVPALPRNANGKLLRRSLTPPPGSGD